jgi:hypothetical protein
MITNTNHERRFFGLTRQSIQLVNQGKRSDINIQRLNEALQLFKENKSGESIWKDEDGLMPVMELSITIPSDMPQLADFSEPYVNKIFADKVREPYRREHRSLNVQASYGKQFIAEIYQRHNRAASYWMDYYHLVTIAKYRGRDLLGGVGGTVLIVQHSATLVQHQVMTLYCLDYERNNYAAQFHLAPNNEQVKLFEIVYASVSSQPKDFVVFYRPKGFSISE